MSTLKIISGGQTGVDRAALDAAIETGIAHGGWCPAGRRAEDGRIPAEYQLQETQTADYKTRTCCNVRDADATLIIYRQELSSGTLLTWRLAQQMVKPCYLIDITEQPAIDKAVDWLIEQHVQVLNVAGPRQSHVSDIYARAYDIVSQIIQRFLQHSSR